MSRIAVIDDEPEVLELLRDILTAEGHDVVAIAHPCDIGRLEGTEPELFFIDLMLPAMSGMQLAFDLREAEYEHIPMVALSASRLELLLATRSGLFQDALVKPFELQDIAAMVKRHAGRYVSGLSPAVPAEDLLPR